MRVVVVGAGAVGMLFGALLSRAGHRVSFLSRGASTEAIRTSGVSVTRLSEEFVTGPLAASSDAAELGPHDVVIVAVKAWQVAPLAPSLVPLLADDALVLPIQNGVEAADELAPVLGDRRVLAGLCHVIASRVAPGRVRSIGSGFQVTMGERRGASLTPRVEELAVSFRAAGITTVTPPDVRVALWDKLLFVEPLGSVGAASRSPIGVVRSIPQTRALLEGAMSEVGGVASARGVRLPDDAVPRAMARVDAMPVDATTSMHRDLVEGRPSELHHQTGAVVRFGLETGTPRPLHDVLFATLLPQEVAR